MNGAMGTRVADNGGTGAALTFLTRGELARGPRTELFVFMDQHEDSLTASIFKMVLAPVAANPLREMPHATVDAADTQPPSVLANSFASLRPGCSVPFLLRFSRVQPRWKRVRRPAGIPSPHYQRR